MKSDLKEFLDQKYYQFNTIDFIAEDPIRIPHQFDRKEDIEISGFLAALIAWGKRSIIIRNAQRLVEMMDMEPFDFVMNASDDDMGPFANFVHRTFNSQDCIALLKSLRNVYQNHDGLEGIFSSGIKKEDSDVFNGIIHARNIIISHPEFPSRTHKHVANPAKGSSAKRINMYLRWMVRPGTAGVDFGLWKKISPSQLICPLDVHTGNVARKLEILTRKQNDWKAAIELTENLRKYDPKDPVKYDFSLFGLGVYDAF